jgi:hypothetical protein
MKSGFLAALGLAVGVAITGTAALAGPKHDGTWSVQMVTDSGVCDRTYSYSIAIQDGSVRYLQGPGDSPTTVSGQVGPGGSVDLDIRRSVAKVDALGQLNEKSGSGTWRLGMLGCSGRWTAQKRMQTVQN